MDEAGISRTLQIFDLPTEAANVAIWDSDETDFLIEGFRTPGEIDAATIGDWKGNTNLSVDVTNGTRGTSVLYKRRSVTDDCIMPTSKGRSPVPWCLAPQWY